MDDTVSVLTSVFISRLRLRAEGRGGGGGGGGVGRGGAAVEVTAGEAVAGSVFPSGEAFTGASSSSSLKDFNTSKFHIISKMIFLRT